MPLFLTAIAEVFILYNKLLLRMYWYVSFPIAGNGAKEEGKCTKKCTCISSSTPEENCKNTE